MNTVVVATPQPATTPSPWRHTAPAKGGGTEGVVGSRGRSGCRFIGIAYLFGLCKVLPPPYKLGLPSMRERTSATSASASATGAARMQDMRRVSPHSSPSCGLKKLPLYHSLRRQYLSGDWPVTRWQNTSIRYCRH